MRILSRSDVQKSLSMKDAIAIVRDAFAQLSTNQATVPVRVPIPIQKTRWRDAVHARASARKRRTRNQNRFGA